MRFNDKIKEYVIHDLLHDFFLIQAEMTTFMHVNRTHPTRPIQKHNVCHVKFQNFSFSVDDCFK